MPHQRTDIPSDIETLIGLKLFDIEEITEKEKNDYQRYFQKQKETSGDADIIRQWYYRFLPDSIKEISRKVRRYLSSSSLVLVILSFIIGITAAGVLFYYDGTAPINVLSVLTAFIAVPLLLLIISILGPLLLTSDATVLSPLFHWIEHKLQASISRYDGKHAHLVNRKVSEYELVYNEPVLLYFRQTFQKCAAVYVTAALLWMIFNVTTTDLAFSWSSTLELEGETIYTITSAMSVPWAWILPSATVDLETVESTRFFRGGQSDIMDVSSGRWWSFLFMSMMVYSLIPRLLLYLYYRFRLKRSLTRSLVDSEEGHAILTLSDEGIVVEASDKSNTATYSDDQPVASGQKTKYITVLLWYLSEVDHALVSEKLNRKLISLYEISGLSPTSDDKLIAQKLAADAASKDNADVLVFVKSWESPNIRLERTLTYITEYNARSVIRIIPVTGDSDQITDADRSNWSLRIASLNRDIGSKRIFFEQREPISINTLS